MDSYETQSMHNSTVKSVTFERFQKYLTLNNEFYVTKKRTRPSDRCHPLRPFKVLSWSAVEEFHRGVSSPVGRHMAGYWCRCPLIENRLPLLPPLGVDAVDARRWVRPLLLLAAAGRRQVPGFGFTVAIGSTGHPQEIRGCHQCHCHCSCRRRRCCCCWRLWSPWRCLYREDCAKSVCTCVCVSRLKVQTGRRQCVSTDNRKIPSQKTPPLVSYPDTEQRAPWKAQVHPIVVRFARPFNSRSTAVDPVCDLPSPESTHVAVHMLVLRFSIY